MPEMPLFLLLGSNPGATVKLRRNYPGMPFTETRKINETATC